MLAADLAHATSLPLELDLDTGGVRRCCVDRSQYDGPAIVAVGLAGKQMTGLKVPKEEAFDPRLPSPASAGGPSSSSSRSHDSRAAEEPH